MKVAFKDKELAAKAQFSKQSNLVIGYGENLDKSLFYLIADDNLSIKEFDATAFAIVDNNHSQLIQCNKLNLNRSFFVDNYLLQLFPYTDFYTQFLSNDICNTSKMYKFFQFHSYDLPQQYLTTALNEQYKFNLIEGYLMFVNLYINRKFEGGHYFENFEFLKKDTFRELSEYSISQTSTQHSDLKLKELAVNDYESLIADFIATYLYDETEKEIKSKPFVRRLFTLIDSIFIENITKLYFYETFYDSVLVIHYKDNFYFLKKYWWG